MANSDALYQLCYDLATAWYTQGHTERALHYWRQSSLLDPQAPAAHYWSGRASQDLRRFAEARQHYRRLRQINPNYSDVSHRLASIDAQQSNSAQMPH